MSGSYDPDQDVQARVRLALAPTERLRVILNYHVQAGVAGKRSKGHALRHCDVENRLATGHRPTVDALGRLCAMGLSRHDAIHQIADLLWKMERSRPWGAERTRDESLYQRRLSEALRNIEPG